MSNSHKFGPLHPDDHLLELTCPACHKQFGAGDFVTLVSIGPGDSEEGRARCRAGRVYNAVAIPCHWACVTGGDAP